MKNTTERKVTVTLPAELADRLERAREKAREVSGYRPSLAKVAERYLRIGAGLE
ncbi:MAG: hypothetical protein AB7E55_15590 [Pigmentiphaga sp.]|jgi:hypothetical protein|uniref:Uncharacterized protein n=1 Tax=Stutzerimonas stutzeri TaxID=316 RepID=A0AA40RTA7_STUST|nr:hypothetical protein [Stutzerimonas stutzeri]MBA1304293.1 hypothetical protein [Stutzerimonas stutzeri]